MSGWDLGRLYQCARFTSWMVVCTSVHGLQVGWSFVLVCMVYKLDGRVYKCAWFTSWMVVCTSVHGLQVGWSLVLVCMVYKLDGHLY